MRAFLSESKKCRARLLLILLPVFGFLTFWCLYSLRDLKAWEKAQEYDQLIILLLLMNSVFLPVTIAVMASRMMDLENKGNTYKLLCTLQKKSSIFDSKLLFGFCHLLLFYAAELALALCMGAYAGITQAFPARRYLLFLGTGLLADTFLLILQLFFSLWLQNQLYPLFIGLIGSFLGLFALFFPPGCPYQYLCPWAWPGFGCHLTTVYDEATKIVTIVELPLQRAGLLLIPAALAAAFAAVRLYFIRKDV